MVTACRELSSAFSENQHNYTSHCDSCPASPSESQFLVTLSLFRPVRFQDIRCGLQERPVILGCSSPSHQYGRHLVLNAIVARHFRPPTTRFGHEAACTSQRQRRLQPGDTPFHKSTQGRGTRDSGAAARFTVRINLVKFIEAQYLFEDVFWLLHNSFSDLVKIATKRDRTFPV